MTPVSASMQDQMADGSLSPVYVIRMHFWENANERQVSRLTRRAKAGHGCLQGGQPDNAGETDEATDGKNSNKGRAFFGRSLNCPEQWHGHDVDAEVR